MMNAAPVGGVEKRHVTETSVQFSGIGMTHLPVPVDTVPDVENGMNN
jgi:hypothetical protein